MSALSCQKMANATMVGLVRCFAAIHTLPSDHERTLLYIAHRHIRELEPTFIVLSNGRNLRPSLF
jgi:hypothetical protein